MGNKSILPRKKERRLVKPKTVFFTEETFSKLIELDEKGFDVPAIIREAVEEKIQQVFESAS